MTDEIADNHLAPAGRKVEGFSDLFDGHFPGHTMQRVRTPDGKYRYSYVSPEVLESFGLDPTDLVSREAVNHEWIPSDDRERFVEALERSAANLEVLDEEVRVELPDGKIKWVRSIGHPRRLEDGTVIWDGVALDVTDRREALDALERALSQARRDEVSDNRFAAIAARDIAAPFNRLSRAIDGLKSLNEGSRWPRHDRQAVTDVIVAFEAFSTAFGTARDLVAAGKDEPAHHSVPGGGSDDTHSTHSGFKANALTSRQREVLQLLQHGSSNREIAQRLKIGEGTVKLHVSAILRALGVKNRTMAAALVNDAG